jgi:hypothetical protein
MIKNMGYFMAGCRKLILLVVLFPVLLSASVNQTLPSWHWAYEYIAALQIRGCFEELYMMNRPFTRGDVARAVIQTGKQMKESQLQLSQKALRQFYRLAKEFEFEIHTIQGKADEEKVIDLGLRLQADLDKSSEEKSDYRGLYRTKIDVPMGPYMTLYNGISVDQYKVDDPLYEGKRWLDNTAYSEQAYAFIHISRFRFKFGRDFLRWGTGENGTLLFSDMVQPMDQFSGSVQLGPFRFSFLTSVLDEMDYRRDITDSQHSGRASRYVSAHRLDAHFLKGKLQCAVTEAVIYGGDNRNIEWIYLNPLMFFHAAQVNNIGTANTLGTIDMLYYPIPKLELYGSLLIDDIQVEKKIPGDLEPDEIGFIIGTRWADPFQLSGLTLSGEYVRVANRTYKTSNPWERFVHRNVPLGHPLGNDFDQWQIRVSQWILGDLWFEVGYGMIRKGEGSIYSEWDNPWMDYTIEEGYSEPFPTGIVEKSRTLSMYVHYYPSTWWGFQGEFHSVQLENAGHVKGIEKSDTLWKIGLWIDWDIYWKLK